MDVLQDYAGDLPKDTWTVALDDMIMGPTQNEDLHKAELLKQHSCIDELLKSGLATNLRVRGRQPWGKKRPAKNETVHLGVDLTDQARALVVKEFEIPGRYNREKWKNRYNNVLVATREIRKILNISEPSPASGVTVSKVNFVWGFQPTEFWNVCSLQKADASDEQKGSAVFALFDDGWELDSSTVSWSGGPLR